MSLSVRYRRLKIIFLLVSKRERKNFSILFMRRRAGNREIEGGGALKMGIGFVNNIILLGN
jgi:hypothetical protein